MINKIFQVIKENRKLMWIIIIIMLLWVIIFAFILYNRSNSISGYKFSNLKANLSGSYFESEYYITGEIKNINGKCKDKMSAHIIVEQNNSSISKSYRILIDNIPPKGYSQKFKSEFRINIPFDNFLISVDSINCKD